MQVLRIVLIPLVMLDFEKNKGAVQSRAIQWTNYHISNFTIDFWVQLFT